MSGHDDIGSGDKGGKKKGRQLDNIGLRELQDGRRGETEVHEGNREKGKQGIP
jgi:hypothetical protein